MIWVQCASSRPRHSPKTGQPVPLERIRGPGHHRAPARARTSRSMAWMWRATQARLTRTLMNPGPAIAGETTISSATAPALPFTAARSTASALPSGTERSSSSRIAPASALGFLGAPSCADPRRRCPQGFKGAPSCAQPRRRCPPGNTQTSTDPAHGTPIRSRVLSNSTCALVTGRLRFGVIHVQHVGTAQEPA